MDILDASVYARGYVKQYTSPNENIPILMHFYSFVLESQEISSLISDKSWKCSKF